MPSTTGNPATSERSLLQSNSALLVLSAFAAVVPMATVPASYDPAVVPRLGLTAAATGVALVAIAASARPAVCGRRERIVMLLAAWILTISAAAAASGPDPVGSLLGEIHRYQGLLPGTAYLGLMAATAAAVRQARTVRPLLWGLFAGSLLSASYVVLDFIGLGWVTWHGIPNDRALGLFGQPNVLAIQLLSGLAAAPGLWSAANPRSRDLLLFGGTGVAAVLLLTLSRAGWLAAVAAAVAFILLGGWRVPSWRPLTVTVAVAAVLTSLVALGVAGVTDRIFDRAWSVADGGGQSTRVGLWKLGVEMVVDEPIIGSGPDSFAVRFPQYRNDRQPGIGWENIRVESSHNILIDRLVDTGIAGAACFVALVLVIVVPGVRHARRRRSAEMAAVLAILVAYYTATSFSFAEAMTGWIPWLLLGALLGLTPTTRQEMNPSAWRLARVGLAVSALSLVSGAAVVVAADLEAGRAEDISIKLEGDASGAAARAVSLNPLHRNYLELRGMLHAQAGDNAAAHESFHRLNLVFAPTADSLLSEAESLYAMSPRGESEVVIMALLQRAQDLDPFNESRTNRAVALLAAMRRD